MSVAHRLLNVRSGEIVVPRLKLATSFWQRFRGLQFHRPLAPDEGLMLIPCRSLHTHWVFFNLSIMMLDREGVVLAIHPEVKPWRMLAGAAETCAVVEMTACTPPVEVGDQLAIMPNSSSQELPRIAQRFAHRSDDQER